MNGDVFLGGRILAGCGYVGLYSDSVGMGGAVFRLGRRGWAHGLVLPVLYQILVLHMRIAMSTCKRKYLMSMFY